MTPPSALALYVLAALREAGHEGWTIADSSPGKATLTRGTDTLQVDAMFSGWRITGPRDERCVLYAALPHVPPAVVMR
jgi:hypothetical protein